MTAEKVQTLALVGGVLAVALVAAYLLKKAATPGAAAAAGGAIGTAAVQAVEAAGTGAVVAIGESVGIPQTNTDACTLAMQEGRTWDASFACPAPVFMRYLANGAKPPDRSATSGGAHGAY